MSGASAERLTVIAKYFWPLSSTMLPDKKALDVVGVIGAELKTVGLGDRHRNLQDVDRVETQSLAIQWCGGIDLRGRHFQVERFDDQFRQLVDFVRNGLLDPKARPENLRKLIPRRVPSGRPIQVFQ